MKPTIICPIYKSKEYLDFMINGIKEHTEVPYEIMILGIDPTDEIDEYISSNYSEYRYIRFDNKKPEDYYINRIYRAFDYAIRQVQTDVFMLYNSDMYPSKNWLKNLLKYLKKDNVVVSRLVESGKMPSGAYGITKNFGRRPKEFDKEGFLKFAEDNKKDELWVHGLCAPILMYKETYVYNGGYAFSNLKINTPNGEVTEVILLAADRLFFGYLRTRGVYLCTAFDSIVYHIALGEQESD